MFKLKLGERRVKAGESALDENLNISKDEVSKNKVDLPTSSNEVSSSTGIVQSSRKSKKIKNNSVHPNTKCHGCGMNPIVGIRFVCEECENVDICEPCHAKSIHNHHSLEEIKFSDECTALTTNENVENELKTGEVSGHTLIICDGCQMYPIIGVRYKCRKCDDFDLCEKCFDKKIHSQHLFYTILKTEGPSSEMIFCDSCGLQLLEEAHGCELCFDLYICTKCFAKGIHGHHEEYMVLQKVIEESEESEEENEDESNEESEDVTPYRNAKCPSALVPEDPEELMLTEDGCCIEDLRDKKTRVGWAFAYGNRAVPQDSDFYYFEMKIKKSKWFSRGAIAIGLKTNYLNPILFPLDENSYTYHGDDGKTYHGCKAIKYGSSFYEGDVIGCGVNFLEKRCFFTKNGKYLKTAFQDLPPILYPMIALDSLGSIIQVNFGPREFTFDMKKFIEDSTRDYLFMKSLKPSDIQPKYLNPADAHPNIILSEGNCLAAYSGLDGHEVAGVRGDRCISNVKGLYYYEVTIIDQGETGYIGVGLATSSWKLNKQPGWDAHSIGYHGDDGFLYRNGSRKYEGRFPKFSTGDVVGCGVEFSNDRCFFTKNGVRIRNNYIRYNFGALPQNLYPAVGLHCLNAVVRVNFGFKPFSYDIAKHDWR